MYKFRNAEPRDLDVLLQMCRNFYAGHNESVIIKFDDDSTYLSLQQMLEDEGGLIVVATEGEPVDPATIKKPEDWLAAIDYSEPIVGMVGFSYFRPPINLHIKAAREAMFWIEPEHRNSGLARSMLSVANIGLKADDVTHVYLTALANSPENVGQLYSAMGFTEVERSFVKEL